MKNKQTKEDKDFEVIRLTKSSK